MEDVFVAVIVSYNPTPFVLANNVSNLCHQGFDVIVVDNHSDNISEIKSVLQDATVIELAGNLGIATALNYGMREAKKRGATWVLSSDQDTEIDTGLLDAYRDFLNLDHVGALCPSIYKRGESKTITNMGEVEEVKKCPTSGFFIKMSVWETIGDYNEWMFIDYVDYDICIRLRIAGFRIYRINTTFIIQELGKMEVHKLLYQIGGFLHWKRLQNLATTYNHSPLRNYYFVRNSLYYIHKYKRHLSSSAEYKHLIKWELKKILLERDKIANIKAIVRGIRDYKKNSTTG